MSDILNDDELGHLPSLSQSRYEHMHEQYNSVQEDEEHWQDVSDLYNISVDQERMCWPFDLHICCVHVTGFGSMEESPPQCFTGADKEGGREEEVGEKDEGGGRGQ